MQLSDLARDLSATTDAEVDVTGCTHNSAWVKPGDVYVALKGARHDGHSFIADAVARGAVAVMGEGLPEGVDCPVPYVQVEHPRAALAAAAAAVAGRPSEHLDVVGVTGTDGKTTTSNILLFLLRAGGRRTGLVSTVGYQLSDGAMRQMPQHFTTPEAPQVQQILADLVAEGADSCVLESSSHALVLERVGSVRFRVGVWTHLSREHLDFHHTMEEYFAAKRRLIERSEFAVLNADDPYTEHLHGVAPQEATYSTRGADADWRATEIREHADGLTFTLTGPDGQAQIDLPMVGQFNVENATAAIVAARRLGVKLPTIVEALRDFPGVPGRMQFVPRQPGEPRVVVDFAHTPDSLEKALTALRATTQGQLWCVLGVAGGARDEGRIAPMGRQIATLADRVVLTEDDSYDTPLAHLLGLLESGVRQVPGVEPTIIEDRRAALAHALKAAGAQDTVLLAGKGAEDFLGRPGGSIPWNEVDEARAALDGRG